MPIYCEDPCLELEGPGEKYRALKLPSGVQPLSTEDLQLYLGFAAGFLDVDSMAEAGSKGPAHRKALKALMDARRSRL